MDALQALVDKQAICELAVRYSTALDTRDWALLETCFVPDAVFEADGFDRLEGFAQIRHTVDAALAGLDHSQHFVTNFDVRVDGDVGTLVCYLQAQHVRTAVEGDPNFLVAGTYRDDVVRTTDGWRFARRTLAVIWTAGNPAVPEGKVASVDG